MNRPRRRRVCPAVLALDERCLLSGLTPAQVVHAYGLDAITFSGSGQTVKGDGSGQTIAIVDAFHDPFLTSDLHTFDQTYHLSDPSLTQVNLGGSRTDDGWAQEETLDVEWAHAIAPGAAIVVVEAKASSLQAMVAAVETARNLPGVSVVSLSWGMAEASNQLASSRHFTTPPGHTGVTFIASSGDEGPAGGAEWPALVPGVLAVGGTSLLVDSAGNYTSEGVWYGSSGGTSRYMEEPAYQRSVQSSGRRSTPDVAFVADPATGVEVYTTAPSTGIGRWIVEGGTSVGAPAWAGIIAIVNQGRATVGAGALDGASQTLPTLYSISSNDFHKVPGGAATSTGLGTPNGAALVNDLAFATTTATPAIVTTRGTVGRATRTFARRHGAGAGSAAVAHFPSLPSVDAALEQLAARRSRYR
jgi:subtilase family serine protease